jgi:hypothetical protein
MKPLKVFLETRGQQRSDRFSKMASFLVLAGDKLLGKLWYAAGRGRQPLGAR